MLSDITTQILERCKKVLTPKEHRYILTGLLLAHMVEIGEWSEFEIDTYKMLFTEVIDSFPGVTR